MIIEIGKIKDLLNEGKKIKIKSRNGEYHSVTDFIEKGIISTFLVELENKLTIKVSEKHKFFTNAGWLDLKKIVIGEHSIFCEDGSFSMIKVISPIGKFRIVDISVNSEEQSYFGNGMLNHNSGKSLICAHIMANLQKEGGLPVLIDTENAINIDFFKSVGLSTARTDISYLQFDTVEQIFESIDKMIEIIRKKDKDKKVIIVVDSLSAASTKFEMSADFDKDGYATQKALIINKALRKLRLMIGKEKVALIFTSQLREKLNVMPGADKYTTSGGLAMSFYASIRVRLSIIGKIKIDDNIVGVKVKALVLKTRGGPPFREVEFDIYFDRGIDDYISILTYMIKNDIVTGDKRKYSYKSDLTGIVHTFSSATWKSFLEENSTIKTEIFDVIGKKMIMEYSTTNISTIDGADVDKTELPD